MASPLLVSAATMTSANASDLDVTFESLESNSGIRGGFDGGTGPSEPAPENESVRNAAELLLQDFDKGQCRRLCAELAWLAPEEMSQVMGLAADREAPGNIVSRLSHIADEAVSDHECLMLLELAVGGLALSRFSGCGLQAVLEKLGRRAPNHERREEAWKGWADSLNGALNAWNEKDPSATARIDGLLASIRSSAWRAGYVSPTIDRLISLANVIDARQRNIGRYFLYSAAYIVDRRSRDMNLGRRFLEIQYATDRIAACGDLARAKTILSEAIREFRHIEKEEPSVHASYFIRRLQSLLEGVMTVLNFTALLNATSLADAVSLYRSPDYLLVPPVHIVIRGLRRSAATLALKGKLSATFSAEIHATVRELARIRIVDPILGNHLSDADLKNIHGRLLGALGAGGSVGQQEWASLLAEAADLLTQRNLLIEAHDLLRAFQKIDVCELRYFSHLSMSMVTNAEILLHKTSDPELRARLSELRDRLVEWQETFDC